MNSNNKKLQDVMVTNSNREFRKIKSSKFLYEINSNGTIVRNVKSKKQLKIVLDYHHSQLGYYYVWYLSKRHSIASLVAECWLGDRPCNYEIDHIDRNPHNNDYSNLRYVTKNEQMKNRNHSNIIKQGIKNFELARKLRMKPVTIINNNTKENYYFESYAACSRYLSQQLKVSIENIRQKLKKRRKCIYNFDIIYRNAETGSSCSTEQGTVQINKDVN